MSEIIEISTEGTHLLERRRLADDEELAPGAAIVGTYFEGRLLGRSVADPEWTAEDDLGLFDLPRRVAYIAQEGEGGVIRAEVFAVLPAADVPREPWEPEPEQDGLLLLGVVIRLAAERTDEGLHADCISHFANIVFSGAEPVSDRFLRSL